MLKLALWEINAKNSVYHTNEIIFSPNNTLLHICIWPKPFSDDGHKNSYLKSFSQHINYFFLQYSDILLFRVRWGLELTMSCWIWVLALKVSGCLVYSSEWASYASLQKKESRCCTQSSSVGWAAGKNIALCFYIWMWLGLEKQWKFKKNKKKKNKK